MLISLNLRQIRYFIALFEEESVTRAAERLHVVQPAISMQIRKLEAEYGLVLFDRTSQGVLPNNTASEFYRICTRIMSDVEVAHNFLIGAKGRVFGDIAVGTPPSLSLGVMARIVNRHCEMFPQVKLRIVEGYSSNIIDWLESGEIDFGILTDEFAETRFSYIPLIEEELLAVAGNDHFANMEGPMTGHQFATLDLILPSAPNLLRRLINRSFSEVGIELTPRLEIDSLTTVLELLRGGCYVTMLPGNSIIDVLSRFDLRAVRVHEPVTKRMLVAAHNSQKLLSRATETFIDLLREELTQPQASAN
ncbi:LysR family transcriptional regulator [Mesorhizobium sp. A623]